MDSMRQAFLALPDTVIITDAYWYILDFNHVAPFDSLRKGVKLTRYMPDCTSVNEDEYRCGGRVHSRKVAPVHERGHHVGYTVYLADITRKVELVEELRRRSAELERLTEDQAQANAELEECARQAEELATRTEQLRVARSIHDDAGHAITALHTISQMCLQLGESDPERYSSLLAEGRAICEKVRSGGHRQTPGSLRELLEGLERESLFPITVVVRGEDEDPFVKPLHGVIVDICKEAYYNTLSHSLAENLTIEADMAPGRLRLRISDDGRFRGDLELGFGLATMVEKVQSTGGTISFHAEEGEGFGINVEWQVPEDG